MVGQLDARTGQRLLVAAGDRADEHRATRLGSGGARQRGLAGRGLPAEVVRSAASFAQAGIQPDLTLVLDVPPEVGRARQVAAGKRPDRLEAESAEFHRRVSARYLAARGDGVRHLDGCLPPDRLAEAAWEEIVRLDPRRFGGTAIGASS